MEYRQLGRTGLRLSAVGLGCGNFGGIGSLPSLFGQGENEREAHAILDTADDMGINFFDTANAYGGGRSEAYIGSWLRLRGSQVRQRILLSTKVFNRVGQGPNEAGLSRRHILTQIEHSLQRLRSDYVDMYLLHEPDWSTPVDETLRAFDDLLGQGKVRYIGASNVPAWFMAKALWLSDVHGWDRLAWVQNSFSLLDRADEREVLPLCAEHGLGYTPFSPLAGGWLTGKYQRSGTYPAGSRMTLRPEPYTPWANEHTFTMLERLKAYAQQHGTDMAALALAWLLGHPQVTAPIVGPRKPEHLETVRQAIQLQLSDSERDEIAAIFEEAP